MKKILLIPFETVSDWDHWELRSLGEQGLPFMNASEAFVRYRITAILGVLLVLVFGYDCREFGMDL